MCAAPTHAVVVRCRKETFQVELDPSAGWAVFHDTLTQLTGIPRHLQRLVFVGGASIRAEDARNEDLFRVRKAGHIIVHRMSLEHACVSVCVCACYFPHVLHLVVCACAQVGVRGCAREWVCMNVRMHVRVRVFFHLHVGACGVDLRVCVCACVLTDMCGVREHIHVGVCLCCVFNEVREVEGYTTFGVVYMCYCMGMKFCFFLQGSRILLADCSGSTSPKRESEVEEEGGGSSSGASVSSELSLVSKMDALQSILDRKKMKVVFSPLPSCSHMLLRVRSKSQIVGPSM